MPIGVPCSRLVIVTSAVIDPPADLLPGSSLVPRTVVPRTVVPHIVVRLAGRNLALEVAGFACRFPAFPDSLSPAFGERIGPAAGLGLWPSSYLTTHQGNSPARPLFRSGRS